MKKIFINGGIGDFFAIVSLMPEDERDSVSHIYYATRAEETIRLFSKTIFKNLKEEVTICTDFTPSESINKNPYLREYVDKFCVLNKQDILRFKCLIAPEELDDVEDFSLQKMIEAKIQKRRKYHNLDIILKIKSKLKALPTPDKFIILHPWSDNQRYKERDFSIKECEAVTEYLEKRRLFGVVINKSNDCWPVKSDYIIDYTNKLNIFHSIDTMKYASGFIGCSSSFSVLAPKLYDINNIVIKAPEAFQYGWWKLYYEPAKFNYFLHTDLNFIKTL